MNPIREFKMSQSVSFQLGTADAIRMHCSLPTTTTSYFSPKGMVLEKDRAQVHLPADRRAVAADKRVTANMMYCFMIYLSRVQ
jgi:hypothetical protein